MGLVPCDLTLSGVYPLPLFQNSSGDSSLVVVVRFFFFRLGVPDRLTRNGPWPVRNQAAEQEVSSGLGLAREPSFICGFTVSPTSPCSR